MKAFKNRTEREILAVAIAAEEEDARIYLVFAEDTAERYPSSAKMFEETGAEENRHRRWLVALYSERFDPPGADPSRRRQGVSQASADLARYR